MAQNNSLDISKSQRGILALTCALTLNCSVGALAQEPRQDVEPDRPDVTNGTHIVDIGLLQIELGGLFTRAAPNNRQLGTPFTARVGLTDWLEARIGTDGLLTQTDGFTSVTGIGNMQIGAKLRLWADPGGIPVLSILPTVNVPAASVDKGLGSGVADYTLAVLTGTDIGRHAHVDVNYGIGEIGSGDGGHFVQHLVSLSASDAISDNWNPYIEAYWFSRQDSEGGSVTAIDAGAIYELGARYALDGGVQIGISSNAPAFAAFGGVSIIVGNILGNHGVHARQRQKQRRAAGRPQR
jgi:outer membrane putative beta-barrel porin/alpha-amylase